MTVLDKYAAMVKSKDAQFVDMVKAKDDQLRHFNNETMDLVKKYDKLVVASADRDLLLKRLLAERNVKELQGVFGEYFC